MCMPEEPPCYTRRWYFSGKEIEDHSPSRKDGIDFEYESHLRMSYCKFIQELGEKLKLPQVKIASGMMLCHRFYMHQSHARNDWQTIATASLFLACKIEDTPRNLKDVVLLAYELMYAWDPLASQRIRKERKVYDKQKQLILVGERLLMSTIAFDFDIQLPYKPLAAALKKLELSDLAKVAWNFVNDSLRTTLCLQYKPDYIAASSIFLAATALEKMELLAKKKKFWWLEFEVSPKQLKEVVQQMTFKLVKQDRKQAPPTANGRITQSKAVVEKAVDNSPQTCVSSGSMADYTSSHKILVDAGSLKSNSNQDLERGHNCLTVKGGLPCQMGDCGSANSVVVDGDGQIGPKSVEPDRKSSYKSKIDANRIRQALKRRRSDAAGNMKLSEAINAEIDCEAWIERELENGIEMGYSPLVKKQREDVSFELRIGVS
ncbi:cyclin-T1-3 [Corylus avellana]|uniref:cyclin-T1-3 n=1 Tax=Corylus avellana TaxID=13451 RepID=UPI00286CAC63|nr:cyclin-T1-3 [Corylus avellana]XP_059460219.1 cyclin-T1-3 [Corylus avellana]